MGKNPYRPPLERVARMLLWLVSVLAFVYLMAPLLAIIPLSFNSSTMLTYPITSFSLHWYEVFFESDQWVSAFWHSMSIGAATAVLATTLGTLCALGLAQENVPLKPVIMGFVLAPVIVPTIITAVGIYFFFAPIGLTNSFVGIVLAHTALAVPFVVITVSATLAGLDRNLISASQSLGAGPTRTFFKVILPLVLPGVVAGALFAFAISLDEIIIVMFLAGPGQVTLPLQMFNGIKYLLSPTITAVATMLMGLSILLLGLFTILRRRGDRLRKIEN